LILRCNEIVLLDHTYQVVIYTLTILTIMKTNRILNIELIPFIKKHRKKNAAKNYLAINNCFFQVAGILFMSTFLCIQSFGQGAISITGPSLVNGYNDTESYTVSTGNNACSATWSLGDDQDGTGADDGNLDDGATIVWGIDGDQVVVTNLNCTVTYLAPDPGSNPPTSSCNGLSTASTSYPVTILPCNAAITASSTIICPGGTVSLQANTGYGGYTYSWSSSTSGPISSVDSKINVTSAATYKLIVDNGNGCQQTAYININLGSNPTPASITAGNPTTFCSGGNVVLTSNTSTGQWCNGSTVLQTNGLTYTAKTTGSYTFNVTNSSNCTSPSNTIAVTVNALPSTTISPTSPVTFCNGSGILTVPSTGTSYQWYNGTTAVGTNSYSYTATTSGNYTVNVTNSNNCSATTGTPTVVTVIPATVAANMEVYNNTPTSLTLSSGISGGVWSGSSAITSAGVFTPSIATIGNNALSYTVSGCTMTQSINVMAPLTNMASLSFDGINDFVSIPDATVYDNIGTGPFAIEAWVNMPTTSPSINPILSNMSTDNNNGFIFEVVNGTSLSILIGNRSTGLVVQSSSNSFSSIYDGKCHYLVVSRMTDGAINFFLDGSQVITATNVTNSNNVSNPGGMIIGGTGTNVYPYLFKGIIDDLRFWNTDQSTTNNSDMNVNIAGSSPGLIGYWTMGDGGQILHDASATANNAILPYSAPSADLLVSNPAFPTYGTLSCFTPPVNTGLSFTGNGDYVQINNIKCSSPCTESFDLIGVGSTANTNGDFTIEATISLPTTGTPPSINNILFTTNQDDETGFEISVNYASGKTQLALSFNRGSILNFLSTTFTSIYDGNCHSIAVKRANTTVTFYLDGSPISSTASTVTNSMALGGSPDNYSLNISNGGSIHDLRFWNYARANADILTYHAVDIATSINLVGYYKFNEVTGSQIVTDASGNANNGFLGLSTGADAADPTRISSSCFVGDRLASSGNPSVILSNTTSDINVYPNPFNTDFMISIIESDTLKQYTICIIDMTGETISIINTTSGSKTIVGDGLSSGMYLIKSMSSDGEVQTTKVIKY
jgi:hypothetical protein